MNDIDAMKPADAPPALDPAQQSLAEALRVSCAIL